MEKFLLVNGCAFRYADTLRGDTAIVLIHGYFESLDIWEHFMGELGRKYRVIALDLPGHGISTFPAEGLSVEMLADTVAGLLEKIGVEKAFVAGHSMGGYVAMAFARKYPSKTEGLILLHSIPDADDAETIARRDKEIELILGGKKELLARVNPGKAVAKANHKALGSVIEELEEQAILTEDEGAVALLTAMKHREDANDFIAATSVPVLAFWGADDAFIPLEKAREVADKHKNITSVFLQNSGHLSFIEQEAEVLATFEQFINKA